MEIVINENSSFMVFFHYMYLKNFKRFQIIESFLNIKVQNGNRLKHSTSNFHRYNFELV